MKQNKPLPPEAQARPETSIHHGCLRQDDYAWLKTPEWLAVLSGEIPLSEEIRHHLEQENSYTAEVLKPLQSLQQTLVQEMRGRMVDDEAELPEKDGPFEYYWRYTSGSEHPLFARRPSVSESASGGEKILLDANLEAQAHDYFELGDYEVSPDHTQLAWSADCRGAELARLFVRNLATGEDAERVIENVSTVTWLDNRHLLYCCIDADHHASKVFRHCVDMPEENDVLIYQERDPAFEVALGRLRSGKFVEIICSAGGQDEVWLLDTADPLAAPSLFQPRTPGLEYSVDHQDDRFFILTNAAGCDDFQIMTTSIKHTGRDNWTVWLAPERGVMVLSVDVYKNWVIWLEQRDTLPSIHIQSRTGKTSTIDFKETAFELDYDLCPEYDCNTFRFTYESPTTPTQIWHYDLISDTRCLLRKAHIPSGHDPHDYRLSRLHAVSMDGTHVPVTCLHHRLTPLDGTAPCVLEGYGSYGYSLLTDFDSHRLSLVDRGVIYALAHVRGGEENGRAWYEAAKGPLKPNSMHDFIACATTLSEMRICRAGGIVALGRSAGGLLVGAVINQAPHLFKGVVADVPFVDCLSTLLDASHPLTPGEWEQWGNPLENRDAYDWIASYSPYDNIVSQDYPAMLVTTALADPRVGYWEAAKWVAKLRRFNQGDKPILLHTHTDAGHSGEAGRYGVLAEIAREFGFITELLGATRKLDPMKSDSSDFDT